MVPNNTSRIKKTVTCKTSQKKTLFVESMSYSELGYCTCVWTGFIRQKHLNTNDFHLKKTVLSVLKVISLFRYPVCPLFSMCANHRIYTHYTKGSFQMKVTQVTNDTQRRFYPNKLHKYFE